MMNVIIDPYEIMDVGTEFFINGRRATLLSTEIFGGIPFHHLLYS